MYKDRNSPLVSVVIPIFNVEKYIHKCVDSIIMQTYTNLQIILIDDGATDSCPQICDTYAQQNNRICVIHKQNGGLSDARNAGIEAATGAYIMFIDSDDYAEVHMLQRAVETIEEHNADVAVWGFYADFVSEEEQLLGTQLRGNPKGLYDKDQFKHIEITEDFIGNLGYAWNKLYRTSVIKENHYQFTKGLSLVEDIVFNVAVLADCQRIVFIDEPLLHYMQRSTNTLGTRFYDNHFGLKIMAVNAVRKLLLVWGVPRNKIEEIWAQMGFLALKATILALGSSNQTAKQRARWLKKTLSMPEVKEILGAVKPKGMKDQLLKILMYLRQGRLLLFLYDRNNTKHKRHMSISLPHKKETIRYKLYARYLLSNPFNRSYRVSKSTKKMIVTLAADYGNLGDVAITDAQVKFLKQHFPEYEVIELPISKTFIDMKALKKVVSAKDIITIVGGGNTSDIYDDIEYCRQFVINQFPKNCIISFPQTIDFTKTEYGNKALRKAARVYGKHKRLTLIAREAKSFAIYNKYFSANATALAPDIVLCLNETQTISEHKCQRQRQRNGITLCMRNDLEKSFSLEVQNQLIKSLESKYELKFRDTHIGDRSLSVYDRQMELDKIWTDFKGSKLVITDRLHGMIFCAITSTPCIAIDNLNKKLSGVYHTWLRSIDFIRLVEDLEPDHITGMVEEIMQTDILPQSVDLTHKFQEMIEILKKYID